LDEAASLKFLLRKECILYLLFIFVTKFFLHKSTIHVQIIFHIGGKLLLDGLGLSPRLAQTIASPINAQTCGSGQVPNRKDELAGPAYPATFFLFFII